MKMRFISLFVVLALCCSMFTSAVPAASENVGESVQRQESIISGNNVPVATDEEICRLFQERHPDMKLSDIFIAADYGTYKDCRVVLIGVKNLAMTCDMLYLNIAGYTFEFESGSYKNLFLAYHNGAFTTVQEAYTQGILTKKDISSIYCVKTGSPFRDVMLEDWFYSAVRYAFEKKLMNGISDDEFQPDGTMTRAMLVTVLWRTAGSPKNSKSIYSDVEDDTWYSDAVAWASSNGYVNGVGYGRFAPKSPVTREQFVTILYRLSGDDDNAPDIEGDFADATQVSSWSQEAMRWAIAKEIIEGSRHKQMEQELLYLDPGKSATRAQAAAILMRFQNQKKNKAAVDLTKGFTTDHRPKEEIWQGAELADDCANAIADFSIDLFRRTMESEENTVLSPLSALYALAMLTNGTDGRTKEQLEQTIGLTAEEMNNALREIRETLKGYLSTVNLANSIWIRDGFEVKPNYLQINADYYQAAAYQAPFSQTTVYEMNEWISQNTDGLIPKMIEELSDTTVVVLMNALLFEAGWRQPYSATEKQPFYLANGDCVPAEMLKSKENLYLEDEKAIGFRKNFCDSYYDFVVIVPKKGITLEEYLNNLDGASLRKLLTGIYVDEVQATMPKFKTETRKELNDVLCEMGIVDAFSSNDANLSGIANGLYVSEVLHQATIDVNENGASAAAATVIEIERKGPGLPEDPIIKTVTADRPYLYMIIDTRTNLPLFIGTTVTLG